MLVIILISFRSLSVPVLLVASIEAAIAINLGIPTLPRASLPFIASIVLGTIQLGATVDYSILMTTRYREERLASAPPGGRPAVPRALQPEHPHKRPDLLCRHFRRRCHQQGRAAGKYLSAHLPGRAHRCGGHPVVLPAGLMLLDGLIRRTTYHWLNAPNAAKE